MDLFHDTRHLCIRLRNDGIRLRTDVRKATLRGFSWGKQELKFANTSNLGSGLFILDNRKWTTFYRKDDNGKLLVEVII